MIPFARMPIYGNAVVQPTIKKIASASESIFILYSTGELYSRGTGTNGKLGNGTTTNIQNTWFLTLTDVRTIFVGNKGTLAIKNDSTMWYVGDRLAIYGSSGTTLAWTDITSRFASIGIDNIKDIQLGTNSMLVLSNAGILYGCGSNANGELGRGNQSAVGSLVQLDTAVDKIYMKAASRWSIKTDGSVWSCGSNANGEIAYTSQYLNNLINTQITMPTNTGILGVSQNLTGICFLLNTASGISQLYYCGYNRYGAYGTGILSDTKTYTLTRSTAADGLLSSLIDIGGGDSMTYGFGTDGMLYSTGMNQYSAMGNGTTQNKISFSNVIVGLPSTETSHIKYISCNGLYNTTILYDKLMYRTGQSSTSTPYNTSVSSFTLIQDIPK